MSDANAGNAPPLHCLDGRPAPDEVREGWRAVRGLPDAALPGFRDLLLASLAPDADTSAGRAALGRDHGIGPAALDAALRTAAFVLERAAAADLDVERLRADLRALSGAAAGAHADALAELFGAVRGDLRARLVRQLLADHGNVLVGLDWRVDRVESSARGGGLSTSVVFLTLKYLRAGTLERITLQLTPEALNDLKTFFERFRSGPQ